MVAINYQPNYLIDPNKNTKMRSDDRVFVLEKIPGTDPLDSEGMIDKRLFSGQNKIHAIRDESSANLWYFKYEFGVLPADLQGIRFTKFSLAETHLQQYFAKRNMRIKEVID